MVVAHGAGKEWNALVRQVVAQVEWNGGPVETAFLMGEESESAGWNAATAALTRSGAKSIVVVPLLVQSSGAHYRQVQFYAGQLNAMPAELAGHDHRGPSAPTPQPPMAVTAALDTAPELGLALTDFWRALGPEDRRRPLLLVAHGPERDDDAERWTAALSRFARRLGDEGGIPTTVGLIRDDAAPGVRAAAVHTMREAIRQMTERGADSVTVLPVTISSGRLTHVTIPADFAGLPVSYHPVPLASSPHIARWIARVAQAHCVPSSAGSSSPAGADRSPPAGACAGAQ